MHTIAANPVAADEPVADPRVPVPARSALEQAVVGVDEPEPPDATAPDDAVDDLTPSVSGVHRQAVRPCVTRVQTHAETVLRQAPTR